MGSSIGAADAAARQNDRRGRRFLTLTAMHNATEILKTAKQKAIGQVIIGPTHDPSLSLTLTYP